MNEQRSSLDEKDTIYEASILVVDDDPELRTLITEYLTTHGFYAAGVHDGKTLDEYLGQHSVDLLILDIHLPGENGLSIARRIAADYQLPIIFLSQQSDDIDRIIGLEAGADDYLPKPFNPRELLARVRAVLRRMPGSTKKRYIFGGIVFKADTMTLKKDGATIKLTTTESNLLKIFCDNQDQLLSRNDLLQLLKGYDSMPDDRSIDVNVTRLRRKISEIDKSGASYINTVWGQGYKFTSLGTT